MTKQEITDLSYNVLGACIEVHKSLGPGLLESVYHSCLIHELTLRNINFVSELIIPIKYKEIVIESILRCDLLIENVLVLELKSVKDLAPVYDAQLMTYMKLLKAPKGMLINFNCYNLMQDGQKSKVNEYFNDLP